MVRSYANQGVQLGLETVAGQAAAADRRLLGLRIDPRPALETRQHKPSGSKVATQTSVVTNMTEADYEGELDYITPIYPLSSIFGEVTPIQPDGATAPTVYDWEWIFTGREVVTPATFTAEVGDETRASRFASAAFTSMEWSVEREGDATISGSMLGRNLEVGQTLTADPEDVDIRPINNDHWDVYVEATGAALDGTPVKYPKAYEVGLNFGDILVPEFTLNSSNESFESLYEGEDPTYEWTMMVLADANGEAFIANAVNNQKRFIRLQATGPEIATGFTYEVQIDMCVAITEFDSYESADGKYVLPISFVLAYDATWGRAMRIRIRNDRSAL